MPCCRSSRSISATRRAGITRSGGRRARPSSTRASRWPRSSARASGTIVFTSGATESNNLAIKGVAARGARGIAGTSSRSSTEHRAVLDPCRTLEREGFRVTYLAVNATAASISSELREAMTDETLLVSVDVGQQRDRRAASARARLPASRTSDGALFHCDAVQSAGLVPHERRESSGSISLSLSAHKIYGPKGIGALYVAQGGSPPIELAAAHRWRRTRARLSIGHAQRARDRRLRQRLRDCAASGCDTDAAGCRRLRDRLWRGLSRARRRHSSERRDGAALPHNLNVRCRRRSRRDAAESDRGRCGRFLRRRVRDGQRGAFARAAGDRAERRAGARVDPVRSEPIHTEGDIDRAAGDGRPTRCAHLRGQC